MELFGSHLFSYRLEGMAKRGSHGQIWRAKRSDGLAVAVKKRDAESGFPLDRFEKEALLFAELTRDGVVGLVALLDVAEWNGETVMVFPWYPQSLEELTGEPWERLKAVLASVARTLNQLHGMGVIHGDVTPGNILLDSLGRKVWLADLGLAQRIGKAGWAGVEGGAIGITHGFGHPDRPEPGPHTDWHSLGVCAWKLATGTLPEAGYRFEAMREVALKHGTGSELAEDLAWWLCRSPSPKRILRWLEGKTRRLPRKGQRFWLMVTPLRLTLFSGIILLGCYWIARWFFGKN